ncbi:MAG: peroxiredoxin [Candidatus Lokiarchaeia archaeon]
MVNVGDKAPDFCLMNQDNKEVCLKDFLGKWVVLYIYVKDNTKSCTVESIDFSNASGDFEKLGAKVVGVSPDSPKSHSGFAAKQNLDLILLSDPEHKMLEKYGAWGKKKMYGKEYMGVIRSTFIIDPKGKIAAAWPKVRVKGHVEEVKQKLKELK